MIERFKEGFCQAQYSPDPFGGNKKPYFPWARIVHIHPAGLVTVLLDFLNPHRAAAMIDWLEMQVIE